MLQDINKVGVVGAGAMGFGIAINFALWGYPTTITDINDKALHRSMRNIESALNIFVDEGLIIRKKADEVNHRITFTTDLSEMAANSDFITEAITERPEDKRELFNKLDNLCPPHTIIASNTSFQVLSDFASDVKRQRKIIITHYFIPPHIVPGVEVAKGPGTSDETFNITCELMKKIRKVPIRIAKELPGNLMNRIQNAMRREAYLLWAAGYATAEDIEMGIRTTFGFRMANEGPMMHYDLSGVWKYSQDIRDHYAEKYILGLGQSEISAEIAEKIKRRMAEGKPWIIDPNNYDEAKEKMDRAYIKCLKCRFPLKIDS